jgi:hypothetical protein
MVAVATPFGAGVAQAVALGGELAVAGEELVATL